MERKVFLGVGHGGKDPGASGGGLKEKDITLTMALACKAELEKHGIKVGMSRTKDEDDPLTEEIRECNAFDPEVAVDIHVNAGGGDGFEAYYSKVGGLGKTLAECIEAEVKALGQNCARLQDPAERLWKGLLWIHPPDGLSGGDL